MDRFRQVLFGLSITLPTGFLAFVWSYMARNPDTASICFRHSFSLG